MHKQIEKIKQNEGKPKVLKKYLMMRKLKNLKNFMMNFQSLFIIKNKMLLKNDGW